MDHAARMDRMGTEAAFRVFARAKDLEAAGRDVIHLEMGEPGFPTPPHVVEACARALRDGKTGYAPAAGLPALREAIARETTRTRGIPVDPSQVVVTPGGKPVIFFSFLALVERGDRVAYPDPGFPIFESMTDALGAVRAPYGPGSGTATRPDLVRLEARIASRPKLLVLNSPGNPTGVVHWPEEVRAIARMCDGGPTWVLSDEIYSRILFGPRHASVVAEPGMAERTILLDGFSKTYSMTGWRLGWAVLPRPLAPLFEKLMTNSVSCATNFAQHAALAALDGPHDHLAAMVAAFRERRDALVGGLREIPGIRCDAPEGSFFVFADVRETGRESRALAEDLLERAGVACVDGAAFGAAGAGFLRFSLAADLPRIREAVTRIGRALC
jgi:aspartate/methionine/tyrosine aminotransferase